MDRVDHLEIDQRDRERGGAGYRGLLRYGCWALPAQATTRHQEDGKEQGSESVHHFAPLLWKLRQSYDDGGDASVLLNQDIESLSLFPSRLARLAHRVEANGGEM
jgi:hypothetical protein